MRDYEATPVAQKSWNFRAFPDHPVRAYRMNGSEERLVYTWSVPVESEINPSARIVGNGFYRIEDWYENSSKVKCVRRSYWLVTGPYSIYHLSDGLAGLIQTLLSQQNKTSA